MVGTYVPPLWRSAYQDANPAPMTVPLIVRFPQALAVPVWQCAGQFVTVASLGAGSIAFVNIVRSFEPFFSVVFGALLFGSVLPWQERRY